MKQRILLILVMTSVITGANAQKKQPKTAGYAITAVEKGGRSWKELRLVDAGTGEAIKAIYESKTELPALNARTGKPVVVKAHNPASTMTILKKDGSTYTATIRESSKKVVNLDQELNSIQPDQIRQIRIIKTPESVDQPFSTSSAAAAYDKKHQRLYYTPMGINQLRYIDLKSGAPKLYYFEDEAFGVVKGMHDVASQVTRMVIASDGKGYALSNDGNHLIRFSTGRKPVITDLGALADDGANGENSVHSRKMYGGDMIADNEENLYLVTAGRHVFKISIETMTAKYLGAIKGLPGGFSTNGAMVEEGSKVIIASSQSTEGYYRFDLVSLESEKVSGTTAVFNASDLANGNLAVIKKKKDQKEEEETATIAKAGTENANNSRNTPASDGAQRISVYPNPVTNGVARVLFDHQPAGKYLVQLLDLSGKLISSQEVNVLNDVQVVELRMPELSIKGNYFLKISSETNKVSVTNKLVVQ